MKNTRNILLILLALAVGPNAFAQSNDVPGPSNYQAFSGFIANRNIFDPSRVPHRSVGGRIQKTHVHHSPSAPFLSLVGIMSYNKGTFAFFNANDSDLKQILTVSGKIAGYTLTELNDHEAKLVSDDKKQTLDLKVGDVLREGNGRWELSDAGDAPAPVATPTVTGKSSDDKSADDSSSSSSSTDDSTPSSANQPNEILKRLMQLREKENQ